MAARRPVSKPHPASGHRQLANEPRVLPTSTCAPGASAKKKKKKESGSNTRGHSQGFPSADSMPKLDEDGPIEDFNDSQKPDGNTSSACMKYFPTKWRARLIGRWTLPPPVRASAEITAQQPMERSVPLQQALLAMFPTHTHLLSQRSEILKVVNFSISSVCFDRQLAGKELGTSICR